MSKIDRGLFDETLVTMFSPFTKYNKQYLFYAHIIAQCSVKINEDIPAPAGVSFSHDHYNLYINPKYFDEYSLENRMAILKHEMLHILNDHVNRTEDREHLPWNFATDCAINQLIDINHLPENCILPKTFPVENCPNNKTSEFYYDLLKQEFQNNKDDSDKSNDSDSEEGSENNENLGELIGSHETWKESEGDKDLQKDLTKKMIEKTIADTVKMNGDLPQNVNDWLELHSRVSELNWKKVLRGIVGNKKINQRSTIMRRDRRFPGRDDLRGKTKDRMFNLLLISDVSGSVSDNALLELWGEVRHICDVTKTDIDLIQVDVEPSTPEKLSKKTKIISRKSRGGTILNGAIDSAKKHGIDFDAIVVTTDGYLDSTDIDVFNKTNKKIIWLVEKSGRIMSEMNSGKMKAFQLKE